MIVTAAACTGPYEADYSQFQLSGLTIYEIGCIITREGLNAIRQMQTLCPVAMGL